MAVAAVALLVGAPVAAWAHPLGLPATIRVAATAEREVTVIWSAAPDDVTVLARSIGVEVPDGRIVAQAALADASEALRQAFADGVQLSQASEPCDLEEVAAEDIVTSGARLVFRCPRPVDELTVAVTLLSDLDARYRTLAAIAGPDGTERTIFTAGEPQRPVRVSPRVDPAGVLAGGGTSGADRPDEAPAAPFGGAVPFEGRFVAVIDGWRGAGAWTLGLLVALGVGALHGLAPGHGKAIAAAYLVGDRGRPRHAVALGATVSAMHTGSVLALGLALYAVTRRPDVVVLDGWLRAVAGGIVAGLGAWLLARRWRDHPPLRGGSASPVSTGLHAAGVARGAGQDHGHTHTRTHTHTHDHANASAHAPTADPLSWSGLVALGAAGGLLPSPSALLVLFTGLALGRVGFALALIGAFSIGLAATVTLVGLLALWGRDLLRDRGSARVRALAAWAPLVGAGAVLALGAWLLATGVGALT